MKPSLAQKLPKEPGVYILKNKRGEIIYIGKSVNIRSRVKTHLANEAWHAAPSLENPLKTETACVDYIVTANEPEALIKESELIKKYQPRYNIMLRDDKQYFYVGFAHEKPSVVLITHQPMSYKLRPTSYAGPFTDGKSLKTVLRYLRKIFPYYTQAHRKLPCQYCHLNLCPGPNPDIAEYKKNIAKIKAILNGKKPRALAALKKEMAQYAKNLEFEKAAKTKGQINALENIFAHKSQSPMTNDQSNPKPQTPNWSLGFGHWDFNSLEAYDISNIQGKEPVASMVRFSARGGSALGGDWQPDKSMYRKFRIRLPENPNDVLMIREVIRRRLAHPEWQYPDVFLIDGGRGQLNAATAQCQISNIKCRIIALAKRFNELYVPNQKNPIPLTSLPEDIKNLLMYARDEAHRFAISYHRKLHRKNFDL